MKATNHKAELVVINRIEVVLHNLCLELHVGAGHEVDPHVGVALPNEVGLLEALALHHCGVQLLSLRLIANLKKTLGSQNKVIFLCLQSTLYLSFPRGLLGMMVDKKRSVFLLSQSRLHSDYTTYLWVKIQPRSGWR